MIDSADTAVLCRRLGLHQPAYSAEALAKALGYGSGRQLTKLLGASLVKKRAGRFWLSDICASAVHVLESALKAKGG